MAENKKLIVISAINFTEGGPLSILKDSLEYASKYLIDKYDVIAFVHRKSLFDIPRVKFIEFPKSKASWLFRLYYEWFLFNKLSSKIRPFLWLSLHDITPRVKAERRAVYCHNPSPFYKLKSCDIFVDLKFTLFNLFYSLLYRLNISKNNWVIVQQAWLRDEFIARYPVDNVVVAHPNITAIQGGSSNSTKKQPVKYIFFYPTYPRLFKNIENLCKAANILEKEGHDDYEVWITIDGTENRYAKKILSNYSGNRNIKFIGIQSRNEIFDIYDVADCLVFPSKLETWGMPISEFKTYNKPIMVANLPYAHETVGDYEPIKYFNPNDESELAQYMKSLISGKLEFDGNRLKIPSQPYAQGWKELFEIILDTNRVKD